MYRDDPVTPRRCAPNGKGPLGDPLAKEKAQLLSEKLRVECDVRFWKAKIDNANEGLWPGQFVKAEIMLGT